MIDGLRLRWRRRAGIHVADWHGRHLSVECDRLGPFRWDRVWCIGRDSVDRGSVEVFGFESTFGDAQRAAESAMTERLTGHERALLARQVDDVRRHTTELRSCKPRGGVAERSAE